MGIDYVVDTPCIPRDSMTLDDIVRRIKDRERAIEVIRWYRDNHDERSPSEIGFEVTRRSADGTEATQLLIAQDALDEAAIVDRLAQDYQSCEAAEVLAFYECFGSLNYPLANRAEIWLLEQLPGIEDPMLFLMLMRGVQEFGYTGQAARELRNNVGVYFQNPDTLARRYAELDVTTDVLFEMTFQLGPIQPAHAAMLLLFFNAIPRSDMQPDRIMALTKGELSREEMQAQFPFQHHILQDDLESVKDYKRFFLTLYRAYLLQVPVLLDL